MTCACEVKASQAARAKWSLSWGAVYFQAARGCEGEERGQRGGGSEGSGPAISARGVITPLLLVGTESLSHLRVCGINAF